MAKEHYLMRILPVKVAVICVAVLAGPGCDQDESHDVVRQLGAVPLDQHIANDEVDWSQAIAELGIDSIAYAEEECGGQTRYSLVLTSAGTARWVGQQGTAMPGRWEAPLPQLDFIRLADFIREEDLDALVSEGAETIDGTCYWLQAWEVGREAPLEWRGNDYPGGDQRLWILRSAVAGMALRIRWDLAAEAEGDREGGRHSR